MPFMAYSATKAGRMDCPIMHDRPLDAEAEGVLEEFEVWLITGPDILAVDRGACVSRARQFLAHLSEQAPLRRRARSDLAWWRDSLQHHCEHLAATHHEGEERVAFAHTALFLLAAFVTGQDVSGDETLQKYAQTSRATSRPD